jgi:ParB family transcriptional regulator, chromosome partitioning protein
VAGERRWRAAQRLSWTEIPAILRTDVDDRTLIRLALLENLAPHRLDPYEEAEGYRALQDLGMTQQAIAEAVHRSQPAIANTIRLLKLPRMVQAWRTSMDCLTGGRSPIGYAKAEASTWSPSPGRPSCDRGRVGVGGSEPN